MGKRGGKESFAFKIRAVSQTFFDLEVADVTCLANTCMRYCPQLQDSCIPTGSLLIINHEDHYLI